MGVKQLTVAGIPSSSYRLLLDFDRAFDRAPPYMRGIKTATNILTKKLVVASSLLGVNRRTN
jgi:hypothetical protein